MIPNVELFTVSVFIAGYIVGPFIGIFTGATAAFIYSAFNPYGSGLSYPLLLFAQVVGMGVVGLAGGAIRRSKWPCSSYQLQFLSLAILGFFMTFFYDALTNLSIAISSSGLNVTKMLSIFISGSVFSIVHLVVNTAIFAFIVPFILKQLNAQLPHYLK